MRFSLYTVFVATVIVLLTVYTQYAQAKKSDCKKPKG